MIIPVNVKNEILVKLLIEKIGFERFNCELKDREYDWLTDHMRSVYAYEYTGSIPQSQLHYILYDMLELHYGEAIAKQVFKEAQQNYYKEFATLKRNKELEKR